MAGESENIGSNQLNTTFVGQHILEQTLETTEKSLDQSPPSEWWKIASRTINTALRDTNTYPPELRDFINRHGRSMKGLLRQQLQISGFDTLTNSEQADAIAERTLDFIHETDKRLKPKKEEKIDLSIVTVPYAEMQQRFPDKIKIEETGEENSLISIYNIKDKKWEQFLLPKDEHVAYKGGLPRIVLKTVARAHPDSIAAEFPLNDIDLVIDKSEDLKKTAETFKTEVSEIEVVDDIDFSDTFINHRDMALNQVFLTNEGLVFTDKAHEEALTGKIEILPQRTSLYGGNSFEYDGMQLLNGKGMMRGIKTIVEGKAESMDFLPINKHLDMGVYMLSLARRWSKKENFPDLMDKLYYVASEMGQVRANESDIYQVLTRVHRDFPYVDIKNNQLNMVGVAKWLSKKLLKVIDRAYRDETHMEKFHYYFNDFDGFEPITEPIKVSLNGYKSNKDRIATIKNDWESFVEDCDLRMQTYNQSMN